MSPVISSRAGAFLNVPSIFLASSAHPGRETVLAGEVESFNDAGLLLGGLTHGDDITGLDGVGRDVALLAVHEDRAVAHELTRFSTRRAEAHAVDDVVETAFEQSEHGFTRVARAAARFCIVAAELAFEDAVDTLDLLLFTQLRTVVRKALAGDLAVLAGLDTGILDLGVEGTAGALQIEVGTLATRELQLGTADIVPFYLLPLLSCGSNRIQSAFDDMDDANPGYEFQN